MRHLKRKRPLTLGLGNRKAVYMNLAKSVFIYKRIETTLGRAKAVRSYIDRIVTYAKKEGLHAYRLVESELHDQRLTKRVVELVAPQYKDRQGGYTRVIKALPRKGDKAPMAVLELVGTYELPPFHKKRVKNPVALSLEVYMLFDCTQLRTHKQSTRRKIYPWRCME